MDNSAEKSASVLLLTVKQVAQMLGISERTVWSKAESGAMPPPVKLGRLRRWRRKDIEGWVAQGCPKVRDTSSLGYLAG